MKLTFVSNYINHHQIPLSNELEAICGKGNYTFIQTEEMEADRVKMGWGGQDIPSYVRLAYISEEENKACRQLILDSDVVIFGGCEDESYIKDRLESPDNKLTFRYNERVYKDGQWKFITPRGLLRKYKDHTAYNSRNVYLLCAGAYVASDFRLFKAYPGKMFKWGYFPEVSEYDVNQLMKSKGYMEGESRVPYFLWAGRFLDWKHPELALETARYLRDKGIDFHMDIIGGGPEEDNIKSLLTKYSLESKVNLLGFKKPEEVREYMKKADIYLFTSDRHEGWGAVANEAMNSGCVVIADHMIGAVPYLIRNGENGCIYSDNSHDELLSWAMKMATDVNQREILGRKAYDTMTHIWNPRNAATRLIKLMNQLMEKGNGTGTNTESFELGPCSPEIGKSEKKIYNEIFDI